IDRLISLLASMGISKIRLTGGEPFVRTDLMELIRRIVRIKGIDEVHITTNGILTAPHIAELKTLGIRSINLSLDTLDRERFKQITRRDEFENTRETMRLAMKHEIPLKINAVVMDGKNIDDIIPMVELTRELPISVRFIEEMPFNGEGSHYSRLVWTYTKIVEHIRPAFPSLEKIQDPRQSTAYHYQVPGFKGNIGVIAAFSRTFCGTCNRLRVTAQGELKTCLYDNGVLNLKALMRAGESDASLQSHLMNAFRNRAKDGFEAEARRGLVVTESMSTIGG
ncbi:MAG: GTP 3',8-cyclase MoaA, partial [Bacteroidota bacterium]